MVENITNFFGQYKEINFLRPFKDDGKMVGYRAARLSVATLTVTYVDIKIGIISIRRNTLEKFESWHRHR